MVIDRVLPQAHMVWGEGGFLAEIGSVDSAGGNVVHITSGVSGLVLALTLGKRRGYDQGVYHVHNTPFVFLGAALLWFGGMDLMQEVLLQQMDLQHMHL